jgi:hypothetical protein
MTTMNQREAELLAVSDRNWTPRKIRGRWVVWDAVSDHAVEFDADTMRAIAQVDYDLIKGHSR